MLQKWKKLHITSIEQILKKGLTFSINFEYFCQPRQSIKFSKKKSATGLHRQRVKLTKRPLRCRCDKNMQKRRVFHRLHYWLRKGDFNNTCQFWLVYIISHTILATIFTPYDMRGRQNYWMLLGWDRGHFFPNHEKIRVKIHVKIILNCPLAHAITYTKSNCLLKMETLASA